MSDIPLSVLFGALVALLGFSAFFSGSETALMSLNPYRLKHMADQGHPGAKRAWKLLQQPDRLIGLILLGNNFINIIITQLATFIGYRLFDDSGIAIATGVLTLVLLIFAEVAPKTLGALHSERLAYPAAFIYTPMLKLAYPMVWLINWMANGVLSLIGVPTQIHNGNALSHEELKSVVKEAGEHIDRSHQEMLLRVLELEQATVEDIMIPRAEIEGIDLEWPPEEIEEAIMQSHYTRMPVYEGNINNIVGYIHMRRILSLANADMLDREHIEKHMREPYFIPESTSLTQQLLNFKKVRRSHAIVVDEYGDVQGLVTMEDLLGEIVGEFTLDSGVLSEIQPQNDGSFIVEGSINIRQLNRTLHLDLPDDGPRTLNGLIVEYLEAIPDAPTSIRINGYPIEITKTTDNAVALARIWPRPPRNSSNDGKG